MSRIIFLLFVLWLGGCGNVEWFPDSKQGNTTPATVSHTALCTDGSYSDSATCSGTCSSHGGISIWYVADCGTATTLGSATATCRDGFLSYSQNCSGTCSSHGGVATWHTTACGGTVAKAISFSQYSGASVELTTLITSQ